MFYFVFIMVYYNELQKRYKSENEKMFISMQANQSQKELLSLQRLQEQTVYYRHDLRHHLSLIKSYLACGDLNKLQEYINQAEEDIDAITPKRYCENNTVNLILSSFDSKAKLNGIAFITDIELPSNIEIRDTDLCTILSNGLENAINAVSTIPNEKLKKVRISCKIHKDKLLIYIENPYIGEIVVENGFPITRSEGHGFGTKSMATIAEKYNGYCSFEAKNGVFILRLIFQLK